MALITIEVHARDVIDKLSKAGVTSPSAFEWSSQLRFYWDADNSDCSVKQVCLPDSFAEPNQSPVMLARLFSHDVIRCSWNHHMFIKGQHLILAGCAHWE